MNESVTSEPIDRTPGFPMKGVNFFTEKVAVMVAWQAEQLQRSMRKCSPDLAALVVPLARLFHRTPFL